MVGGGHLLQLSVTPLLSGANTQCGVVEAGLAVHIRSDVLTGLDPPQVELPNSLLLHLQLSLSPSSCRSSSIPVMAFMSSQTPSRHPSLSLSLSPFSSSSGLAVILLQRQQRGFPGEFYKCLSAGTVGTSLFPSARKRSSERRRSSARWEF